MSVSICRLPCRLWQVLSQTCQPCLLPYRLLWCLLRLPLCLLQTVAGLESDLSAVGALLASQEAVLAGLGQEAAAAAAAHRSSLGASQRKVALLEATVASLTQRLQQAGQAAAAAAAAASGQGLAGEGRGSRVAGWGGGGGSCACVYAAAAALMLMVMSLAAGFLLPSFPLHARHELSAHGMYRC
jgi:hypothetical protein